MSRVDDLPENALAESIKQLQIDIEEVKNRQRVGGNNLVLHYSQTGNTWDVDETISVTALLAHWRVTFTPDTTSRPFTQLCFNWQITPDSGFNLNQVQGYMDPANISNSAVSFVVEFANFSAGDVNFKIKFGMKSVDTGSISWARLPDVT